MADEEVVKDGEGQDNPEGGEKKAPPETIRLKYGETEEEFTPEQVRQMAQLSYGIQRKMQTTKEAHNQLIEDLKGVDNGDSEAYARVLQAMGLPKNEVQRRLKEFEAMDEEIEETPQPPKKGAKGQDKAPPQELPPQLQKLIALAEVLDELPPDKVKAVLKRGYKGIVDERAQEIYKEMDSCVAGDKFLGSILNNGGPAADEIRRLARERLAVRLRSGEEYGPGLLAMIVKDVHKTAKTLGVGEQPTNLPGLGASPGLSFSEAANQEDVKPVPVDHAEYAQNVTARLARFMRKNG